MAWKQDLAKLKQQLGPEAPPAPPKPPPRPAAAAPAPIEEEDAVFLSAMGVRPAHRAKTPVGTPAPRGPAPASEPESFEAALQGLKGLKPLTKGLPGAPTPTPAPIEAPKALEITSAGVPPTPAQPPAAAPSEEQVPPSSALPLRFQLAAGMALEVDGLLDLRGHSLTDALERLKDRLGDGQVLGWRSMLVTLGSDPALHEGLLSLLGTGGAPMVGRFAQAPVPMGGSQAWVLYFGPPSNPPQNP